MTASEMGHPSEAAKALFNAFGQAIDAVVITGPGHEIRHVNAAAERMWGYGCAEVVGRHIDALLPTDVVKQLDGADTAPETDASAIQPREFRVRRKDGTEAWGVLSVARVEYTGRILNISFIRDVTGEVQRREQHDVMALVADKTDRVVIVTDREQRILYANNAFTKLFGHSLAEAKGRLPRDLLPGAYTDTAALLRLSAQVQADGCAQEDVLVYNKSGQEIWVSAAVNKVRGESGEIKNFVIVLTDITHSRQIHSLQHCTLEDLANDLPVEEVIDALCRRVEAIAPDVTSSVLHVDSDGRLHTLGAPGLPPSYSRSIDGVAVGLNVGSCGPAAVLGVPVLVQDIEIDPRWHAYKAAPLEVGLRACWSIPIKAKDGRVIGTFAFYFHERRGPTVWHQTIVDACVHLCALAIERYEARREITRLAYFDALTGLPNRAQLSQIMTQHMENSAPGERFAVAFLDIDHFKDVNDTLGHSVGDDLLVRVTKRLREQLRPTDTLSRQGGDEFVVVLPNCDAAGAAAIVDRMLAALLPPMQFGTRQAPVSASVGISIYPDNATDIDGLLKQADAAMYKAKQAGRSTYRFFSAEMNRVTEERLAFSAALRAAIVQGELRLHYQPQLRTDGSIYGVEALARWHDPVLGDVPPSKFIPLAEECGLIELIGMWSLQEACRQIAAWRHAGLDVPCVSVNLSPINFQNEDLATLVAYTIASNGLSADMLMLEITESVVMNEHSTAIKTMERIRASGVGLSMDDFGTGYSSLNRLAHLPIRELKIDRSFVRDIESQASALAITTAMVRVGQSLNMTVVAEGVETEGQRRILTEMGCDVIQGFLYSPALSAFDFEAWLAAHQAERWSALLASRRAATALEDMRTRARMPVVKGVR